MGENEFTECLKGVLYDGLELDEAFEDNAVRSVDTFEEAGVMTLNKGLVVTLADGSSSK